MPLLVLALSAGPVLAQAGPAVVVEAGLDGRLVAGRWNPITFRIDSPTLTEIDLVVRAEEGRTRATIAEAVVRRKIVAQGLRVETLVVWIDGGRPVQITAETGRRILLEREERPITETPLTLALTSNLGALGNVSAIPGQLVVTRPEALPAGLLAHDPVDTLVIGDLAALADWTTARTLVITGRHLVLLGQDAVLAAGEMSPIAPDGRPRDGAQVRAGTPLSARWRWGAGWVDAVWTDGPLTVVPVEAAAAVAAALQPPPRLNLERALLDAEGELARDLVISLPSTEVLLLGIGLVVIGGIALSLSRDHPRRLSLAVAGAIVIAGVGWVWLRGEAAFSGGAAELHVTAGSARGAVRMSLHTSLHPAGGDRRWELPARVRHNPAGGPLEGITADDRTLTARVAPWTRISVISGPLPATLPATARREEGGIVLESSIDLRQIWLVGHGWLGPRPAGRHTLVPGRAEPIGGPHLQAVWAAFQSLHAELPPGTVVAWAGSNEILVLLEGS
jgi:hypothetical protein